VLCHSIRQHFSDAEFLVFITDSPDNQISAPFPVLTKNELQAAYLYKEIEDKYASGDPDYFRWSLKPVLLNYLLSRGYKKIVFTDPDTFYVSNGDFINNILDSANMLLTPHWVETNDGKDLFQANCSFNNGIFNAGFVAVTPGATDALKWWAYMCLYKMEKNRETGRYVDQRYLDLVPVLFEGVQILRHKGCNVAGWNINACKRTLQPDGSVLINNEFPIIFFHFTCDYQKEILSGIDKLVLPYFKQYISEVENAGGKDLLCLRHNKPGGNTSWLKNIKHRLRIRTRIRKFIKG
jgi:hypothetical protein